MKRKIHMVFSTHWDREWIQSFEQYRYRLLRLFDRLLEILEREKSMVFVFDGQTIVLEDYLQLRPESKPRIEELAASGRLVFGPWLILSDLFLEGDEAIVRNLLAGHELASKFGRPMKEGYVPDSFGVVAAMPSILNGFGIRFVNMGRGSKARRKDREKALFKWLAKDGSSLLAMHLGYGNGIKFSYPDIWQDVARVVPTPGTAALAAEGFLKDAEKAFPTESVYASVGVDHMEMRAGMDEIVKSLNESRDEEFIASTPERFFLDVEKELAKNGVELESVEGEMRGDRESPMDLQGVLSTDIPLKQENRACELALTRLFEPLAAAARHLTGYDSAPALRHAWRLLLAVHPHDSICACSDDKTMADIHARLRNAQELCSIATERTLQEILPAGLVEDGKLPELALFNGLPGRGFDSFELLVRMPADLEDGEYALVDKGGACLGSLRTLAKRQMDLETCYATDADLLRLDCKEPKPGRARDSVFTLCKAEGALDFGAAAGLKTLALVKRLGHVKRISASARRLDNGLVALSICEDGTLEFTDKSSGGVWKGLGWLEDEADAGNTYDFLALEGDSPKRSSKGAKVKTRLVRNDSCAAEIEMTLSWKIPARLEGCPPESRRKSPPAKIKGRRSKRLIAHKIRSVFAIRDGIPRIEVKTSFENKSVGHRLRLGFSFERQEGLKAGSHFGVQEREWTDESEILPTRPFSDFIASSGGLAVLSKGLYEFEARANGEGGELLLTICRSTDCIGPAGGCNYEDLENPKALVKHEIRYALAAAPCVEEALRVSNAFSSPLLGRGYAQGPTPPALELASVSNPSLVASACKRAESGDGVVVRLWSMSAKREKAVLRWPLPHAKAERIELSEEPSAKAAPLRVGGHEYAIEAGPFEVLSFKFLDDAPGA